MIRPAYRLTIGDQRVDTTDEPKASTLVDLLVRLDMEVPSDLFRLRLGNIGFFTPEREDGTTIELGYADEEGELVQVMEGQVETVEQGSLIDRIEGYTGAAILLRSFTNQTYEEKTAGEIVQDLADEAGISTGQVDPGINFPAYVIDGRRSFWHHMRELASLCGFDVYFNSDNELVFRRFVSGNGIHVFDHASHILELDVEYSTLPAGQVEAWGESGTTNGSESWAWLTKDFSAQSGSSGTGDGTFLLQKPALRTGVAAQTAADARQTEFQRRQVRGSLLSMGRPQVKLGDAIRLNGLPESRLNQTYQVRGITHRITKRGGFTSRIDFRSINLT